MANLEAIGEYVLMAPEWEEGRLKSDIIDLSPVKDSPSPRVGTVISIGADVPQNTGLKVGDRALYQKYAQRSYKVKETGQEISFIHYKEIHGRFL